MSLRILARRIRFYYKRNSLQLYREEFKNYRRAWFFPLFGDGKFIPRNGLDAVRVPRQRWSSLTTVARLLRMGARPTWKGETLEVTWNDLIFVQPAGEKWTPQIMVEDPWHTKGQDLRGKVVIDIGAFIGDSSIAYAAAGADVHAFEAVPSFAKCAAQNARMNKLDGSITVHGVGLSNTNKLVSDTKQVRSIASMSHNCLSDDTSQKVYLVDAIGYLRMHEIHHADIVKMNCEGGEYDLLSDTRILDYLKPQSLVVDYHYGSEKLRQVLSDGGYSIEDSSPGAERGTLFATKQAHMERMAG